MHQNKNNMTKATIEISEEAYKVILKEQYERRMKGEKKTIAEIASEFLEIGTKTKDLAK